MYFKDHEGTSAIPLSAQHQANMRVISLDCIMPGYLVVTVPVDVSQSDCCLSACVSTLHNNQSRHFAGINHQERHC